MSLQMITFISGVSGVGKSATMLHLRSMLPSTRFDIHDLDERGVPDGGGLVWLNNETRYWLDIAKKNALDGKSTIICGFANPDLFKHIYNSDKDIAAQLILLNASKSTLEERLRNRHSTSLSIKEIERMSGVPFEQFIRDTTSFAETLYTIFKNAKYPNIETDNKTPEQVADEIVHIINVTTRN